MMFEDAVGTCTQEPASLVTQKGSQRLQEIVETSTLEFRMRLLIILVVATVAFCRDPIILREMPQQAQLDYSQMHKRWDLSYTQLTQMVKKWAERYGVQDQMREYLVERKRRDKQKWKKFLKLMNNLPALGDELLSIIEDTGIPLMDLKTEKDNFKAKYESAYKVLRFSWKQFSDLEEDERNHFFDHEDYEIDNDSE